MYGFSGVMVSISVCLSILGFFIYVSSGLNVSWRRNGFYDVDLNIFILEEMVFYLDNGGIRKCILV